MRKNKKSRSATTTGRISREERAALIEEGLWMGRGVVHKSRKDYNRQREKNAVRELAKIS